MKKTVRKSTKKSTGKASKHMHVYIEMHPRHRCKKDKEKEK